MQKASHTIRQHKRRCGGTYHIVYAALPLHTFSALLPSHPSYTGCFGPIGVGNLCFSRLWKFLIVMVKRETKNRLPEFLPCLPCFYRVSTVFLPFFYRVSNAFLPCFFLPLRKDIHSKHRGYSNAWPMMKLLLFFMKRTLPKIWKALLELQLNFQSYKFQSA